MSDPAGPQDVRNETYIDPVANAPVAQPVVAQPVVAEPVAAQPVVAQPVVAQPVAAHHVVATPVVSEQVYAAPAAVVQSARVRRFAPDAIIAATVGLVLFVVGLLAMVRAGFDGSMEEPVVEVLGFTHTATLGIIAAVLGALLLIAGASSSRSGAIFFGAVLGIGGFIGAVQTESFATSLALESAYAWIATIAGAVVVASALLLPRYITRTNEVRAV